MGYALPRSLDDDETRALGYLKRYYGTDGGGPYTGSYYDVWRSDQDPFRFTADDLIAVSFLSVFVPPLAARELLDTRAEEFGGLLRAVGPDQDLVDESDAGTRNHPAWRLEAELMKLGRVGRTTASKLCARKRPRLFPIYDSIVGQVTGADDAQWEPLRHALRSDDGALHERLVSLRTRAGIGDHVSALRVYDVISWMEGKDRDYRPTDPVELTAAELADD